MTECESLADAIVRAVDGTAGPDDLQRLTRHVAGCAACRETLAAHALVRETLRDLPWPEVSHDFAARVRGRLEPPAWTDLLNWRAWTLRLAPVAALLCLLAWWPARATTRAQPLSSTVHAWGVGGTTEKERLLLDPTADTASVLSAAFGESSR